MIWWLIFIFHFVLFVVCMFMLVPVEHRRNYERCRKDSTYYLCVCLSLTVWIVAAIQNVVAPGSFPTPMRIAGIVILVAGSVLQLWAFRVNYYFVPTIVYVPPIRRVTTGPYAWCDHPGYLGFIFSAIGTVWLLGQWWALYPACAYVTVIIRRMILENRILSGKISL